MGGLESSDKKLATTFTPAHSKDCKGQTAVASVIAASPRLSLEQNLSSFSLKNRDE